ncbi:MAG: hypothetical protein RL637_280 [Pseudomonadota bacterium]|jgi:DNA-binding Lrp family transcriptional regulator
MIKDELDKAIINRLQYGLEIIAQPYQQIATELKISEAELLTRLQRLLNEGILTRIGPMFHPELIGGGVTLAALHAEENVFDHIAEIVNQFPEVAHNYQREHFLNMWFVIITAQPEQIPIVIKQIEQQTELKVYSFPKLKEYFIGLHFLV